MKKLFIVSTDCICREGTVGMLIYDIFFGCFKCRHTLPEGRHYYCSIRNNVEITSLSSG